MTADGPEIANIELAGIFERDGKGGEPSGHQEKARAPFGCGESRRALISSGNANKTETIAVRDIRRSELSLTFQEKWAGLRSGVELMPRYEAFDPVEFSEFLPNMVVVTVDPASRTMPIRLAGSAIRDFVGFELTGQDFLKFDTQIDDAVGWQHRSAYHDQPCGRYEELDVQFSGKCVEGCSLTILPLMGSAAERLILVLVDFKEVMLSKHAGHTAKSAKPADLSICLDIGAGVPGSGPEGDLP